MPTKYLDFLVDNIPLIARSTWLDALDITKKRKFGVLSELKNPRRSFLNAVKNDSMSTGFMYSTISMIRRSEEDFVVLNAAPSS